MKYSGIKCLHPVKSFRNGFCQYFPCGRCEVCLSNKSLNSEMLCDFESKTAKQVFFVTNTYSDADIPVAMVVKDKDSSDQYFSYDVTTRYRLADGIEMFHPSEEYDILMQDNGISFDCCLDKNGDYISRFLGSFFMDFSLFRQMARKVRLKTYPFSSYDSLGIWHLPYLSISDHKNFLKRFRKAYDEKYLPIESEIRYYVIGEYGPQSFRPHWHYLFFLSVERPSEEITQLLLKSWKFGRVSVDLVTETPGKYLTTYAAGANLVSPFHAIQSTRPRSLHSQYFGRQVLDSVPYKNRYDFQKEPFVSDEISLAMPGIIKQYRVRRKVEVRRFPKCPGYTKKSFGLRCISYMLYARAERGFYEMNCYEPETVKQLADWLSELCFMHSDPDVWVRGLSDLFLYYQENFIKYDDVTLERLPLCRSSLSGLFYRELFVSRDFYHAYKLDGSSSEDVVLHRVFEIDRYYKSCDYENLKNNLECLEAYSRSWPFETLKVAFYSLPEISKDALEDELHKCVPYNQYVGKRYRKFYDYRKHKDLNDANDIFCYDSYCNPFNHNYSRNSEFVKSHLNISYE